MSGHAYAVLDLGDGRSVALPRLTTRQDALVKTHDALRLCEAELKTTVAMLRASQADLRTMQAELAKAKQRKLSPEQRAEIEAQGMACKAVPGWTDRYTVASHSEPGKTYTVWADGDNWRRWGCDCQGGAHGCRHKRRARQEREAEERRAERAFRTADKPAVPKVRLTVGGRAVQ